MPAQPKPRRLLLLGGTREARQLAEVLSDDPRWSVISSLAGRTRAPETITSDVRAGGFGGAEGLAAYIRGHAIDVVVDATHPFAATISANARHVATELDRPYLRLCRPAWQPSPGDTRIDVPDIAAAARQIPARATAFLTVGRQGLAPFVARTDIGLVARMIEPPATPLPGHATLLLARPPFDLPDEMALMRRHGIDIVVTKNAGGDAVAAKLAAARELGLPVIMIARPAGQPAADATTVAGLVSLLERHAD